MSLEGSHKSKIIIAEKFSFRNLMSVFLESNIGETDIRIGQLDSDGKTVKLKNTSITATQIKAKVGDKVIVYKI